MRPLIQETLTAHTPESLAVRLQPGTGLLLLRSASLENAGGRYSLVTVDPFLTFRSFGSRCEQIVHSPSVTRHAQFGNPWHALDGLMARYELLDEVDLPFPLGGCFGYWGYELKNFTEPRLSRRAVNDLDLPDCQVGFYDSLVVFDHRLGKTWVVSTGLAPDGSRTEARAHQRAEWWKRQLADDTAHQDATEKLEPRKQLPPLLGERAGVREGVTSNINHPDFLSAVARAQDYIRAGDIYQVNLSQRFTAPCALTGWEIFERLCSISPAPYAAYFDCGDFQLASSSPEQFLRLSGAHVTTRPIKGTRPRSADPTRDLQLAHELQTSAKEMSELVMITDLLRNDLGRICEYGSVQVPELARLERFAQVQHLVSTVEGQLRPDVTHFAALASSFPGGSITGAPKIRAMEIIDELEPLARGPYCGCHGYLGFNRESQLSITIRTVVCKNGHAHFNAGAGIVADSNPAAEYDETVAKAAGFLAALDFSAAQRPLPADIPVARRIRGDD